jgi:hypothetical protein
MDGDDGTKTAPRSSNNDDVFMVGPRQAVQHLV